MTTILRIIPWMLAVTFPAVAWTATPLELAKKIDDHLKARWALERITPAQLVDDDAFLRRIYLDLVGRIPTIAEVRDFRRDRSPDKRAQIIDRLSSTNGHYHFFASVLRRDWFPQTDTPQFTNLAREIEGWLALKLKEAAPMDDMVRQLMVASRSNSAPKTPTTFLTVSENKPEMLAANTTRAFLGLNLDCAQCHNHPFAHWKRTQFWETAAFFTSLNGESAGKFEIALDGTKNLVSARFLTENSPVWPRKLDLYSGRQVLAAWVTARENPYFAKNAVNRVWAHFFGNGLVEPLDDLSDENPSVLPELLDLLAQEFVRSKFNVNFLIQSIANTQVYQLTSKTVGTDRTKQQFFALATVRGLTGEQLYDSLHVAAGFPPERDDLSKPLGATNRQIFAAKFQVPRANDADRSILQALSLMNGSITHKLTDRTTSPTLRAVVEAPFLDPPQKVEALYLAAYGRMPTAKEIQLIKAHFSHAGGEKAALSDLFWALLNSSEFSTNH
ncbi:MAG: DUF1553 domain-containing protein [Zavarzinella sp.]